jgi:LytTr DNA-binding domain
MRAFAFPQSVRAAGGSSAAFVLIFALYCQAHSMIEAIDTPAHVSLRWGVLAGAPAGLLLWAITRWRDRLAAIAMRGIVPRSALGLLLFLLLTVGGGVLHLAASGSAPDIGRRLLGGAFDFAPAAAALSLLVLTALWRRYHPPTPASTGGTAVEDWIVLPEEPRLGLRSRDLKLISSAGNYCEFHAGGRVHLVRVPLKVMAGRLGDLGFVQVHRTAIVNLDHLAAVEPVAGGVAARLSCGRTVPVGPTFRHGLDAALAASPGGRRVHR